MDDLYYMTEAYAAAAGSKDRRKWVGACIVGPDGEIVSKGLNGFPRGFPHDGDDRYHDDPALKDVLSEHAERNAIYNAARIGVSCKGCTMFATFHPCHECARAIIQAGIKEVVLHKEFPYGDTSWGETQQHAAWLFEKCKVQVRWWSGTPRIPYVKTSGKLHCW